MSELLMCSTDHYEQMVLAAARAFRAKALAGYAMVHDESLKGSASQLSLILAEGKVLEQALIASALVVEESTL